MYPNEEVTSITSSWKGEITQNVSRQKTKQDAFLSLCPLFSLENKTKIKDRRRRWERNWDQRGGIEAPGRFILVGVSARWLLDSINNLVKTDWSLVCVYPITSHVLLWSNRLLLGPWLILWMLASVKCESPLPSRNSQSSWETFT